jgi:hypothetical protein
MNMQPTHPGPGGGNDTRGWTAHPVAVATAARRQGRSRLRAATVAVGAAGLAVAGVVAYALPGSSHASTTRSGGSASQQTGSAAGTSTGSSGSSGSASSSGSSSTGSSGFSGSSGISPVQGGGQTTSGGS